MSTPTSPTAAAGWSTSPGATAIWWCGCCTPSPAPATSFDPASGHVRLLDGLEPEPGEPVITKTSRNAFTTTNLQQILTEKGIRELVVCGIQTEQCCETTTRLAADLGYDVTFVTEATATFRSRTGAPRPHREEILADPRTLRRRDHRTHGIRAVGPVRHHQLTIAERGRYADQIMPTVVFLLIAAAAPAGPGRAGAGVLHGRQLRPRLPAALSGRHRARDHRAGRPGCRRRPSPGLDPDDLLVVPGWRSGDRLSRTARLGPGADDPAAGFRPGGTVASVCSGAEPLGRAGLLDGRRCTTHHEHQDELAARYPRATCPGRPVRDRRPGRHLRRHRAAASTWRCTWSPSAHGPAVAARIAREMVVYARRNGDDQQASAMLRHRAHLNDTVHRLQDHIDARYTEPLAAGRAGRAPSASANAPLTRCSPRPPGSPRCATSSSCGWSAPST